MADNRLTPHQRAELAWMQIGQPTLMDSREEYLLEFTADTIGGKTLHLKTLIKYEDGVPALARLRQIVLALDAMNGCTVVGWVRTWPPMPVDPEIDEYLDAPLSPPSPPVGD
jgi:hypothetical protein